jgi:hypothetical protein
LSGGERSATLAGTGKMAGSRKRNADVSGPQDIRAYRRHAEWAIVVGTAVELGVLETLAEGPVPATTLADKLGLQERGLNALLGALEVVGVVRCEPEGVLLTGSARAHFVDRDTPDYQGDSLRHWLRNIRRWANELPDIVRSGRPDDAAGVGRGPVEPAALPGFMAAMDNKPAGLIDHVADQLLAAVPDATSLLDLGGGPGTFARAFAGRGLRVTLFDRPEVIEYVGSACDLQGAAGIELRSGDFLRELPEGSWDIVLAANVTHIYSAATNAALVRRAASRLSAGGAVAGFDFIRGKDHFAALFAITMLLNTESGGTYTLEAYQGWMREAGLAGIRCATVAPDSHLVIGFRAEPRDDD